MAKSKEARKSTQKRARSSKKRPTTAARATKKRNPLRGTSFLGGFSSLFNKKK